jgi:sugar phosphate isomerase/epimerase
VPTTSPAAPISIQLYSLRDEAKTNFAPVIERLGQAGFVGVELAGFNNLTPAQFATVAADSGLVVSSAHVGDLTPDALRSSLDDLQLVGCDTAIAAFLPPTAFESLDAVKQSAELINAAHAVASERGMSFGYHNHWWEFENQFDGKSAWTQLFDRLDPPVFAELDIYWAIVGGADPTAVIASVGDRVQFLHVKDGPADDPKHAMVAVGSGSVDIAAILRSAPAARWHVVELDRCDTDMFEAIEMSYGYLVGSGLSTGRV